jgi:NADH-quinone oxidoreductase subunit J
MVDKIVFGIAALACLSGAFGVILARNPVHSALSLVGTLFGIAILFVDLGAHFLAAVQVVVYAGAIVVLFLFVIMLLGVDKVEELESDALVGQVPAAGVIGLASAVLLTLLIVRGVHVTTGATSGVAALADDKSNIQQLGEALFTDYVFAFEVTSVLLVIAVVGAVVLARRTRDRDEVHQ